MGAAEDYAAAAKAWREKNWNNGGTTATKTTESQNLANAYNSGVDPKKPVIPTPYIQGVLSQAQKDTAKQNELTGNEGTITTPTPPVGTSTPTGMNQAMQQMPTYLPPAPTGLNFDQATSQVRGQIDPMFARALEALQAQKHQDQLNGDQLGMARGGAHSGLAADLQNKVGIAAAGKASDLDATRQTQIAQMAQDLVKYGQDYDLRNQQQKLAEYLGLNQLDLQKTGQIADYTGQYGGQQTMQSKNADRGYGLDLAGLSGQLPGGGQTLASQNQNFNQGMANKQFDYQKVQDDIKNGQWTTQTENQMKQWAEGNKLDWAQFNQQTKQALAQIAISQQNANTSAYSAYNSNVNQQADNQLGRDKFNWDKDPLNPSNWPKPSAGNAFNLDDFKGYINQNFYKEVPDPNKPWEKIKQLDPVQTRKYIVGQNLDDAQTDQLLKLYQLPTN